MLDKIIGHLIAIYQKLGSSYHKPHTKISLYFQQSYYIKSLLFPHNTESWTLFSFLSLSLKQVLPVSIVVGSPNWDFKAEVEILCVKYPTGTSCVAPKQSKHSFHITRKLYDQQRDSAGTAVGGSSKSLFIGWWKPTGTSKVPILPQGDLLPYPAQ